MPRRPSAGLPGRWLLAAASMALGARGKLPEGGDPVGLISSKLTYEHLRQMPDDGRRYELIEGALVVSPAPKTRHQRVVAKLTGLLVDAERAGHGKFFSAPTDVLLDPELNALQPDLLFITQERIGIVAENNVQGAPDLAVEVLSESTAERDLGVKVRVYARYGVRFYWVADPETESMRVFELQPGGYLEHPPLKGDESLGCPLFPGIAAPVSALFAG
jgi:Uma2 family endonuclease